MSKQKQATLFQSWNKSHKSQSSNSSQKNGHRTGQHRGQLTTETIDLCDEDEEDADLLQALEESMKDVHKTSEPRPSTSRHSERNASLPARSNSSFGTSNKPGLFSKFGQKNSNSSEGNIGNVTGRNQTVGGASEGNTDADLDQSISVSQIEDLPGFDKSAGKLWIYPTNYPVRQYQYSIVEQALFSNTLVILPTGLGKTFIAAVVMYNFYRWYPQGKIVFMAPTKPLVAQQIEACYNIMGIPQEHTAEMTGAMMPAERSRAWNHRRVFFLTPQVLTNDLSRGTCPAVNIQCLVVDEAHKALGNHAYCQVVRELYKYCKDFRVLALSATPGSDIKAVQQVINNLLISHIELRTEESTDIKPYTHERRVDKIVVPLGAELQAVKEKYLQILTVVVNKLKRAGALYHREVTSLSKFMVLKARDAFRQNPPANMQAHQFGVVEGDFALCMSLYHGYELLLQHGLRPLYNFLEGVVSGSKAHGRTRTELIRNQDFTGLMQMLNDKFSPIRALNPCTQPTQGNKAEEKAFVIGHPKLEKLQEIVLEHFNKFADESKGAVNTRIMIFSQFRDSVNDITEMLNGHRPLVKVMSFIGQSSVGKTAKGFTQKEQLKVMKKFREGGYNTLVSTCVGEEGLDIGDVDLIICFDAHKSPIRLVQRMGRTGRKREGRIVMLVTEGKEEQIYNQSQQSKRSIHRAIMNSTGSRSLQLHPAQRMVPEGLHPRPHKMHITVTHDYVAGAKNKAGGKSKASAKTANTGRKKERKSDGFLNPEEFEYWKENFMEDEKSISCIPQSSLISLPKDRETEVAADKQTFPVLSLNEWMPWQNTLQPIHRVDHSMQSRHLVELLEFMEIQEAAGVDEDNYGIEMAMYLNEDDILRKKSDARRRSILHYCTPRDKHPNVNAKNQRRKKNVRRSETLAKFDDHDEKLVDSDDELPHFDLGVNRLSDDDDGGGDAVMRDEEEKEKDADDHMNEACHQVSVKQQSVTKKSKSKRKGSKTTDTPQVTNDHVDRECSANSSKKKRNSSGKASVIELLVEGEDDTGDFEDNNVTRDQNIHVATDIVGSDRVIENNDITIDQPMDVDSNKQSVEDVSVETNKDVMILQNISLNTIERDDLESKLFPTFTSPVNEINTDIGFNDQSSGVKTPPCLDDLEKDIEILDQKGCLSPVDILQLIDIWQQDYDNPPASGVRKTEHVSNKKTKVSGPTRDLFIQTGINSLSERTLNRNIDDLKDNQKEKTQGNSKVKINGKDNDDPPETVETSILCDVNKSVNSGSSISSDHGIECAMDISESSIIRKSSKTKTNSSNNTSDNKPSSLNRTDTKDSRNSSMDCDLKSEISREDSLDVDDFSPCKNNFRLSSNKKKMKHHASVVFASTPKSPHTKSRLFTEKSKLITPKDDSKPVNKLSSFLLDEDDDFFMGITTPVLNKSANVTGQGHRNDEINFSQAFALLNDTSLQSLDCSRSKSQVQGHQTADDVSRSSKSSSSTISTFKSIKNDDCISVLGKDKKEATAEYNKRSLMMTESCDLFHESDADESANFDLGFDLAEFDEEIIPPSPPKSSQGFSQRSLPLHPNSSQKQTVCNVDEETGGKTNLNEGSPSLITINSSNINRKTSPDQTCKKTTTVLPIPVEFHSDGEESEMNFELGSVFDDEFEDDAVEDTNSSTDKMLKVNQFKTKESLATKINKEKESSKMITDDLEDDEIQATQTFDPNSVYSEEIKLTPEGKPYSYVWPLCRSIQEDLAVHHGRPVNGAHISKSTTNSEHTEVRAEAVIDVDEDTDEDFPLTQSFPGLNSDHHDESSNGRKAEMRPRQVLKSPHSEPEWLGTGFKKSSGKISTFKTPNRPVAQSRIFSPESDDSPVVMKKQKRKMALDLSALDSDEEDFDGVITVRNRSLKKYDKRKEDDSILVQPKKRKAVSLKISFEEEDTLDDDDEDFVDINQTSFVYQSKSKENLQKKFKSKKKPRSAFIENEADLSGEASTDESEHSDLDKYDQSFVNDATQCSQDNSIDVQAMYLRSIQNSEARSGPIGRFKLRYNHRTDIDVYSQAVDEEDVSDDYMEDSFCVANDHEDSEIQGNDTFLDLKPKKSKRKQSKAAKQAEVAAGRKRVRMIADSSSDEEDLSFLVSRTAASDSNKDVYKKCEDVSQHIETKEQGFKSSDASTDEPQSSLRARCLRNIREQGCNSKGASAMDKSHQSMDVLHSLKGLSCDTNDSNYQTGMRTLSSLGNTADVSDVSQHADNSVISSMINDREERLRLCRKRQEEFRRRHAQKSLQGAAQTVTSVADESTPADVGSMPRQAAVCSLNMSPDVDGVLMKSPMTSRSVNRDRLVILVDSREINATQDMVSSLRLRHRLNTSVCQLSVCDYIVSQRMAVERKLLSDFVNGANKTKLLDRVRQICEVYDRPCLIVEKDRVKKGEKDISKPWLKSRYIENVMACLSHLPIKILFTDSEVETAELLADLCKLEARKGQDIKHTVDMESRDGQVLNFWLNVPKMTYVTALNLTRNFSSVLEAATCSLRTLQSKSGMSVARANDLHRFLHHSFDLQMTAS